MPVTVPFSKSTVFKICRQKMCRFRVNGRPIRRIFHRFQNVPASCERSLRYLRGLVYMFGLLFNGTMNHVFISRLSKVAIANGANLLLRDVKSSN